MNTLFHKIEELKEKLKPRFAGSFWHGLCIQVGKGEETKIKDLETDSSEVFPDDNYNLYAYFRQIDEERFELLNQGGGYGDGNKYNVIAPMVLIVHTSDVFNSDRLVSMLESYDDITLVSRNMDGNALFNREFAGSEKKWNYEKYYLFEIRFNLIYCLS